MRFLWMGNSSAIGGDKWQRQTSLTMVVAPSKTFHESCGKLWQQENDSKSSKKKSRRRRSATINSDDGKTDDFALSTEGSDTGKKAKERNQNTRRYLTRLKKARKKQVTVAPLHEILDSLSKEETSKNKYLKTGGSTFSLSPANVPKPKRVGGKKVGGL